MKTRIALFVAILCCAAATWLNLVCVRQVISNHQREISEQKRSLSNAETDLAGLKTQLETTSAVLRQSRDAEQTARRDKESSQVESAAELLKVRQELQHARTELAAMSGVITPVQIAKMGKQIYQLQNWLDLYKEENKLLRAMAKKIQNEEPCFPNQPDVYPMPAELRGRILTCDPKWKFVVVNVGQEHGAKPHGELLVSRKGQFIGWLIISDVEKDRCIANVKEGWQLGEILEGDTVMPAHPES